MRYVIVVCLLGLQLLMLMGCQSSRRPAVAVHPYRSSTLRETVFMQVQEPPPMLVQESIMPAQEPPPMLVQESIVPAQERMKRQWTDRQIEVLRTFALQESPALWQTVQSLKSESAARKAELKKLRDDLVLFGRNPDIDSDCLSLKKTCEDLDESVMVVYDKLEEAYLSYKKFQATPGKKEYGDLMRKALEDGIQEADATSAKYKNLSETK